MKTIRISLKKGGASIVMDSKGEKKAGSLTLHPERGKASMENRKGAWQNEACINCDQAYR
ncbi:hypothetical protein [Hungatella effluvii]|uniref:hypothetical protein n=1 Tax=Hungatella effluvii TaxID=1096246 RepID=UPI002A829981|nr:hypothetical protein [Hungatella effluvii]